MKPVCDRCNGENVSIDAAARWNPLKNEWAIESVFDDTGSCDDCGGECKIEWKEEE